MGINGRTWAVSLARLAILLLAVGGAWAQGNPPTPTVLEGGKVLDVGELKTVLAGGNVVLFDMRSAVNFGRGHLPGAKALPYKERSAAAATFDAAVDEFNVSALPDDKAKPLVFYSHGDTGWKSYKAAVSAIRAGHRQVFWFRGGVSAWEAAGEPVVR